MHNLIENTCPYKNFEFPFKNTLSFAPILRFWDEDERFKEGWGKEMQQHIKSYVQKHPELAEPIHDLSLLEKHKKFVETLMLAVFPPGLQKDEMVAAVVPYGMDVVFATPKFRAEFMTECGSINMENTKYDYEEMLYNKTLNAFISILESHFNQKLDFRGKMSFAVHDSKTNLDKHYQIDLNTRFTEIIAKEGAPKITQENIGALTKKFNDLNLWLDTIPPSFFEIQGLVVFRLIDDTIEESISCLKFMLLEDDSLIDDKKFENLKQKVCNLLGVGELEFGISVFNHNRNTFVESKHGASHSLLTCSLTPDVGCEKFFGEFPQLIEKSKKPIFIDDIDTIENSAPFLQALRKEGIRNLFIAPLYEGDTFVGLLEIGHKTPGKLGAITAFNLSELLPLFSIAVKRNADKIENRIQRTIKENFTAIHPSVEWKFVDSAMKMIANQERGESKNIEPIVFSEVYPLYGASDIRNSSIERSNAIQNDLMAHLTLASKALDKSFALYDMPILDELNFKVGKHYEHIKNGLFSGDEVEVLEFLRNSVEPCLRHVEAESPTEKVSEALDAYWQAIQNNLGVLYDRRKAFEESLTKINETISGVIEEAETKAQALFPHYFEKYKTDGVEYNIYVGDSLTKTEKFDPVHLRNLRLWQLITMHKSAEAAERIRPQLPIPLATTHLILVQSNPLSIQFRIDEKKFDVDGAYNIRYEIVKKRIDKALVKDTDERLTQPNKIAIVYSQPKEAAEYREYLEYMAHKGLIEPDVEELTLEDLQGVQGLKALRVQLIFKEKETIHQMNGHQFELETISV